MGRSTSVGVCHVPCTVLGSGTVSVMGRYRLCPLRTLTVRDERRAEDIIVTGSRAQVEVPTRCWGGGWGH